MAAQLLVREGEARRLLGDISHGSFHELRRRGEIRVTKIGRAAYYNVRDLEEFVERLREQHMGTEDLAGGDGGPRRRR